MSTRRKYFELSILKCTQCFKTVDRQRIANREKDKMPINGENYKMVSREKRKEESKNGQREKFSHL